jgi:hypothetical protein
MAKVLIEFETNLGSLEAAISKVEQNTDQLSESAAAAGKKVSEEYRKVAASAKAAFASSEVDSAIKSQAANVDKLSENLEVLLKEEIKLIRLNKQASDEFKKNQAAIEATRKEFDKLKQTQTGNNKETEQAVVKSKRLTTQLRELKEQLSVLEQQGKENTKEFLQIAVAAARLEDQIGDTRERVKSLASDTFVFDAAIDSLNAVAGGFAVVQGAVGLFAEDNEELQRAIAKTNSALAILNGLQQVQAFLTGQSAGKLAIVTAAQRAYTFAVGTSTGAFKALRIAIAATGFGALVIALGFVITNFEKIKQVAFNAFPALQKVAEGIGFLIDKTKEFLGITDEIESNSLDKALKRQDTLLKAQVNALNRQIALQQKLGKETEQLEIQREQLQLNLAQKRLEFLNKNTQLRLANEELFATKVFELEQEILDRQNNIAILRINNTKEETDALKEQAKAYEQLAIVASDVTKQLLESDKNIREATTNALVASREAELSRLRVLFEQGLATRQQVAEAETKIVLANQRAQIEGIEQSLKDSLNGVKEGTLEEQTLRNAAKQEILKVEAQSAEQIFNINKQLNQNIEESEKKAQEERKQRNQELIKEVTQYVGAVQTVFSSIVDLQNELTEQRIEQIERLRDVELEANNTAEKSFADRKRNEEAINLRASRKITEEKRKQARLDKALGIFNATVDTAKAVVGFLSDPGGIAGIVLSVAAGITGATQIAKISSEPLPSFGRGGWIDGEPHTRGGVDINAEGGEFVTRKSQAGTFRRELEAMNTSRASFLKLIENNYVKPRLMAATLERDRNGVSVNVNARLNGSGIEQRLDTLRQETRKTGKIMQKLVANSNSSRYNW